MERNGTGQWNNCPETGPFGPTTRNVRAESVSFDARSGLGGPCQSLRQSLIRPHEAALVPFPVPFQARPPTLAAYSSGGSGPNGTPTSLPKASASRT